ncbi:MAG TPA: site-specific integrase [Dermatophilaceae bacterium]|nr:site-specific integrase [Dermatophilaceae bacterium]
MARARWTNPHTGRREEVNATFDTVDEAEAWLDAQSEQAATGVDRGQTLSEYVHAIGNRWTRTIDPTSTLDPYSAGLRRRVLPALGHLPVGMLTAGLIDRAIDRWEGESGTSTVKNTVAALVLVLDEAVRDGLLSRNPAKDRARRKSVGRSPDLIETPNPRDLALPDVATLDRLVSAAIIAGGHRCWGDMVTLLATTAMRISEVSGLTVDDVDLARGLVHVRRQTYPGRGGLVTKTTKGRRRRVVPIIDQLRPTLERLTTDAPPGGRLVTGPRGGVITTATLRDATSWDEVVTRLGLAGLVRHGLRHTALTWMADSGVPLHVLQRVAGHQDPAVTARYLHPDTRSLIDAGTAFSTWWGQSGGNSSVLADEPAALAVNENRP